MGVPRFTVPFQVMDLLKMICRVIRIPRSLHSHRNDRHFRGQRGGKQRRFDLMFIKGKDFFQIAAASLHLSLWDCLSSWSRFGGRRIPLKLQNHIVVLFPSVFGLDSIAPASLIILKNTCHPEEGKPELARVWRLRDPHVILHCPYCQSLWFCNNLSDAERVTKVCFSAVKINFIFLKSTYSVWYKMKPNWFHESSQVNITLAEVTSEGCV